MYFSKWKLHINYSKYVLRSRSYELNRFQLSESSKRWFSFNRINSYCLHLIEDRIDIQNNDMSSKIYRCSESVFKT